MDLARLARLQDEPDARPRALPEEMVLHRRESQKGGDRRVRGVVAPVREDQDVVPFGDRLAAPAAEVLDRLPQARSAVVHRKEHRQRDRPEVLRSGPAVERADLLQLDVQEDRRRQVEVKRGRGSRLEEVLLRPDRRVHRHDDRLAVGVHRRVRDLGEELLEVVVEGLGTLGEDGERDVRPHRSDRLGPLRRHRVHEHPHVLERVAERLLAPGGRSRDRARWRPGDRRGRGASRGAPPARARTARPRRACP